MKDRNNGTSRQMCEKIVEKSEVKAEQALP